jgi:hypothetical protein
MKIRSQLKGGIYDFDVVYIKLAEIGEILC